MAINFVHEFSYSSCRQQNPKSKSKTYKSSSPILYIFSFTIHNQSWLISIIISKFSQLLSVELSSIRKLAGKFDQLRGYTLQVYIIYSSYVSQEFDFFNGSLFLWPFVSAISKLKTKVDLPIILKIVICHIR